MEQITAETLLLLGLSAIWLGRNAVSTEIVGKLTIFRRERDIGWRTADFIGAKCLIYCAFTAAQPAEDCGLVCVLAEQIPGG